MSGSTSREAPTPLGTPVKFEIDTFGDADKSVWELSTGFPGTDVTDAVLAENMFNDPPRPGHRFFGVAVKLTLLEAKKEPLSTLGNMPIELFGPDSSSVYGGAFDETCGVAPNEIDPFKEVFVGGSLSGMICFEVASGDIAAGPLLTLDEIAGDRIFVATR